MNGVLFVAGHRAQAAPDAPLRQVLMRLALGVHDRCAHGADLGALAAVGAFGEVHLWHKVRRRD